MNEVEVRKAIAIHMGWTDIKDPTLTTAMRGTSPNGEKNMIVPNYVKNLNAIHKVEERLSITQRDRYISYLYAICDKERRMAPISWLAINATPIQKAEAIIKTLSND